MKCLVKKVMEGKLRNFCPEHILQKLLKHCVVDASAKIGILWAMSMLFPLLETALRTTQVPAIMVLKPVIAVSKVFSIALATFAAINIHLDAWIKYEKFSLYKLLVEAD